VDEVVGEVAHLLVGVHRRPGQQLQFDFAVTGKPILYFVHDLDHYRGDLRNFYFDFEAIAPGPLLTTVDEVLDAIRDVDRVAADHRDRYDRFRQRFCSREDGHSAARVLDLVLPEPVPAAEAV
jgi:CDP-glycerol glycerophosphotransferase